MPELRQCLPNGIELPTLSDWLHVRIEEAKRCLE